MSLEYALSVQQPYAEAILRGELDHTTRDRRVEKHVGKRVYLYASSDVPDSAVWKRFGHTRGRLTTGKIIGTVRVDGCREKGGRFEWVLCDAQRFDQALAPKNAPGPQFWRPKI